MNTGMFGDGYGKPATVAVKRKNKSARREVGQGNGGEGERGRPGGCVAFVKYIKNRLQRRGIFLKLPMMRESYRKPARSV